MDKTKHRVVNLSAAAAITFWLCLLSANAQTGAPRFDDYPVNERYTGKTAPLVLSREARTYRTRLREAAREKPNFAGHFIVTSWGCCSPGEPATTSRRAPVTVGFTHAGR